MEEGEIFANISALNYQNLKSKFPAVDIDGIIERKVKYYRVKPFKERNKLIWINQIKEYLELINEDVSEDGEQDKKIVQLKNTIQNYENKNDLSYQILKIQPLYYDSTKIWWRWNTKKFMWEIIDETDILNFVREFTMANTINSKERNEIIEVLKQDARLNKPKIVKKTWVQFKDKIYDIVSGEEFIASPEWFVTNPIPWELNKEKLMDTPNMDRIFGEWVGEENIKILYEIIAYCILSDYPIHRLFCLIGEGMNGKSCFLRLLIKFIGGENVTSTELDTLLSSRFEVTRLHKKLVCIMGETNFSEMSKTSVIKKLTGQDLIGFEYKGKNPFEDLNYAKILIATNNLPTTTDKTIGFYRRWCIIDFPNRFSEKKDILNDIPNEEFECLALKSLWILKDLLENKEFYKEGTIEERTKKYEDKSNFFDKFWKENIIEDFSSYITVHDFETKLGIFCNNNKQRMLSAQGINEKMSERRIEQGRPFMEWWENDKSIKRQVRAWMGVKWR